MKELKIYTYYKNTKEQRVFLLVDFMEEWTGIEWPVKLLEWGNDGQYKTTSLKAFRELINNGTLQLFTPNFSENAKK